LIPVYSFRDMANQRQKIGRNEPCWCGSGLKFKRCHLGRAEQSPHPFHDFASKAVDFGRGDRTCLYPLSTGKCHRPTIRAHSISRRATLIKIARNGKVYQPNPNPFEIQRNAGGIRYRLVGVGDATTFTGFCSQHDSSLFRPIDIDNILPTLEQVGLLHYRAVSREIYVKRPTLLTNEFLRNADRGKPEPFQHFVQETIRTRTSAINAALRELELDKITCDEAVLGGGYSNFTSCVIRFNTVPTFACSGLTQPSYDCTGRLLQDLRDLEKPAYAFVV
jgi:hypothetical protein